MNKEFIPYEQALELKKLGFNEQCLTSYDNHGELMSIWNVPSKYEPKIIMKDEPNEAYVFNKIDFKDSTWCAAPLYQQAFKWFRGEHDLQYWMSDGCLTKCAFFKITSYSKDKVYFASDEWVTYEEAELECLKKLIEIVQKNNL